MYEYLCLDPESKFQDPRFGASKIWRKILDLYMLSTLKSILYPFI